MQEDYIARHKPKRGIAEKLINFTEDEEQQYEEQSDPEETFVKPKNPPRRVTYIYVNPTPLPPEMLHTKFGFQLSRSQLKLKYLFRGKTV
jgi:hypothetical protein